MVTVADRIDRTVHLATGASVPLRIRAWDASEAGPTTGPVAVLRHRRAIRRLVYSPGELGLADAYIAGDLDVDGDLRTALAALRGPVPDGSSRAGRPGPDGGSAAFPPTRQRRDRPPLRPVAGVLPVGAGRVDGLLLRPLRRRPDRFPA